MHCTSETVRNVSPTLEDSAGCPPPQCVFPLTPQNENIQQNGVIRVAKGFIGLFCSDLGIFVYKAPENGTALSRFGKTVTNLLGKFCLFIYSLCRIWWNSCVFSAITISSYFWLPNICKTFCLLSQKQHRKILRERKGLEAAMKEILFHPMKLYIKHRRNKSCYLKVWKNFYEKQVTFFRRKRSVFLLAITWLCQMLREN